MTTTIPSTAVVPARPVLSDQERQALAGFLAGYTGLTRPRAPPAQPARPAPPVLLTSMPRRRTPAAPPVSNPEIRPISLTKITHIMPLGVRIAGGL